MKLFYKSILIITFVSFYATFCNSQINKSSGKYEYSESGMNVTETRSWSLDFYLQIDINASHAVYFSATNGDVDGKRKLVYKIKYTNNKTIELFYEKCIGFEYPYEEETKCISYNSDKTGDKHFVFEVTDEGLQLLWETGEKVKDKKIFKKVDKFSFVE